MQQILEDLSEAGFSKENIKSFRQQVGCAHMSLKLSGHTKTQAQSSAAGADGDFIPGVEERAIRPSFVGLESVGKSTFINFLVDPSLRRSPLVTDPGMGTQTMTILKHDDCEEIYLDGIRAPSQKDMEKAMRDHALKMKQKMHKLTLENPVFTRTTPFETDMGQHMHLEMVDVPGMKPTVELETALALGVSTALVICVTDCSALDEACEHGNLFRLKQLYQGLPAPRPPIVVAVTKQAENTHHFYDLETFSLLEGHAQVR